MKFLRVLASVIVPPVGVFLKIGFGVQFWINVFLTALGYFPGLIHAIWIFTKKKR